MVRQQVALSHWPYSLSAGVTLSSAGARTLAGDVVLTGSLFCTPRACVKPRAKTVLEGFVPFCLPGSSSAPPASGAMDR